MRMIFYDVNTTRVYEHPEATVNTTIKYKLVAKERTGFGQATGCEVEILLSYENAKQLHSDLTRLLQNETMEE